MSISLVIKSLGHLQLTLLRLEFDSQSDRRNALGVVPVSLRN